jgi:precorrin-4/cobalt-precorrin-4 C11-methyltransferase
VRGTLADIAEKVDEAGIRKTAMILVGRALTRNVAVSKLYDPAFSHEYRVGRQS